jgi:predicted NUDIX family NTP pyrophosphohydrolase
MPLHSAGLLLYRRLNDQLQIFLAHPGGPFWKEKDEGVWSIPKGLIEPGEDGLMAARREFLEETGANIDAPAAYISLGELKQKGNKIVHAWAVEADIDAANIRSNTYAIQWPKGVWRHYPEVDRAGWFNVDEARVKILKGQEAFIDRLLGALDELPATGG